MKPFRRRNAAHREFKKGRKKAPYLRKEYLERLAQAIAADKGTRQSSELKSLKHREKQRNEARRIRRLRRKNTVNKTIRLTEVTDRGLPTEARLVLDTKEEMEAAAIRENERRFTNAHRTPFYQEPLLSDIGLLAETDTVQQILDGTYAIPEDLDQYTKLLLQALRKPTTTTDMKMADIAWTADELSKAWKKQRPNTVSESTSLPYVHHIVGAYNQSIAEVDAIIHSAPLEMGFSPEPWEKITDAAIIKKAGVFDVDKMRTINLMPAAFNMNNKRLGHQMMKHAEAQNLMAKEQDGSRKKHSSQKCFLNKVLTRDISLQKRQAMGPVSNDAKQCYDRMAHPTTILAMLWFGVLPEPIRAMFKVLQNAIHFISTAFGVSTDFYGGHLRTTRSVLPIAGIGQGNGCGPAAFAMLSCAIIRVMIDQGYGARFTSALGLAVISFACYMFVDDCDLIQTAETVFTKGEQLLPQYPGGSRLLARNLSGYRGGLSSRKILLVLNRLFVDGIPMAIPHNC